jgi:FlgD Ig-like domain
MKFSLLFLSLIISFFIRPTWVMALWQPDGVALCIAEYDQQAPISIVPDGAGGAIVTWNDTRSSGEDYDVYAQLINASGVVQWTSDGVAICTAGQSQNNPVIVSDGAGGAIVTWQDYRNGNWDIYAQRIDASGAIQWAACGVALCTDSLGQNLPTIVSDGAGGATVAWDDYRNGNWDIYAQRINASGAVQWTADGVPLCTAANNQQIPAFVSDGAGGAIVTWRDSRNGNDDIYGQRVNASGAVQWAADGVAICTAANSQAGTTIVSNGAGGAIVAWDDYRNGNWDIYAQRIDGSGAVHWTADGVALSVAANDQLRPTIVLDRAGGAIVTWTDYRSGDDPDIYAQRIDASGTIQWATDGAALCTAAHTQEYPTIVLDGAGGAIVVWHDSRSITSSYDIYAQRIDASGAIQWATDGVALCMAVNNQTFPVIVSDGVGGAIVSWEDRRSPTLYSDIYAQRVGPEGLIPTGVRNTPSPSALTLSSNFPNPFSTETAVDLSLSEASAVEIEVFDVTGRRVREIALGRVEAGSRRMRFDGLRNDGRALPSGVYFYRVSASGTTVNRKIVIAR